MNSIEETTEINLLLASYGEALNKSDLHETVAFYTEDGINMPNGAPLAKGHAQLTVTYQALFKAFKLNVEYFVDEVIVNGEFAYVRTHSKGSTLIQASGATISIDNKELFVLRKIDTIWKISHYIFNSNAR